MSAREAACSAPIIGSRACCARRERPRCRAAQKRDEVAPPHAEHRASSPRQIPPGGGYQQARAPAVGLPHAQPAAERPASPWGIEVSHWHALHDAAYLRHLVAMPDVELVAIQDSD